MNNTTKNIETIRKELDWFDKVLDTRLKLYFGHECPYRSIDEVQAPVYEEGGSVYADFIRSYSSSPQERLILLLTLVPHVCPQILDVFCVKNSTYDKGFTEFGGVKGVTHGGFLPTAETALFLLAADNLLQRAEAMALFDSSHYLLKNGIIQIHEAASNEPFFSAQISLSIDYAAYFITGQARKPHFSKDFPARLVTTNMEWDELVLPDDLKSQIVEISSWIKHSDKLMNEWGFYRKLKPGFKTLFYGPPGTGKTLVACLIGKLCSMDVYRIDMSTVVSKYIGETEKNLEKIFSLAEAKKWILFFDEADALFGKRTGVSSAHDRYANQETAYLLQRIEDFNGVIILATNLRTNIDEAFARRFQSVIYFPVPQAQERYQLWRQSFSLKTVLDEDVDLEELAKKHELTGGMILNVVRYSSLMAMSRDENVIRLTDTQKGIQRELLKEGRIL